MASSKKYYWIKLRTDFWDSPQIDFLLDQENGSDYVVIYQMLCTMCANANGMLVNKIPVGEYGQEMIVPYNPKKIAQKTKHFSLDTIMIALELYKQLGLIYEENNNVLRIVGIENMVGSSADNNNAERQRRYRQRQKEIAQSAKVKQIANNKKSK